jgi:ABC-type nitrate/sulfonate/bicarbonate transport system ATPase subunit
MNARKLIEENKIRHELLENLTTQNALDIVIENLEDKISSTEMQMSVLENNQEHGEHLKQQAVLLEWKTILAIVMLRTIEIAKEETTLRESLKEVLEKKLEEKRIH